MVLFESANMMLGNTVVDVQGFSQLVDVSRFGADEVDDLSTVCPATRSRKNVPE